MKWPAQESIDHFDMNPATKREERPNTSSGLTRAIPLCQRVAAATTTPSVSRRPARRCEGRKTSGSWSRRTSSHKSWAAEMPPPAGHEGDPYCPNSGHEPGFSGSSARCLNEQAGERTRHDESRPRNQRERRESSRRSDIPLEWIGQRTEPARGAHERCRHSQHDGHGCKGQPAVQSGPGVLPDCGSRHN